MTAKLAQLSQQPITSNGSKFIGQIQFVENPA
jgi:hypothetical protein